MSARDTQAEKLETKKPTKPEAVAADFMAAKPRVKEVWSETLGKAVYLRSMTALEKDAWNVELVNASKTGGELTNATARLLVRCLCDGGGNLLFKPADADELGKNTDANVLDALASEALMLCGITPRAIEESAKN